MSREAARPESVVVDTRASPHARLQPVPLGSVRLQDTFWQPRLRVNQSVTLPSQYRQCEETGRIDNFRRAAGAKDGPFRGRYYNDSDVYKWVEAAAYVLAAGPDPALETMLDEVVRAIASAQQPDGYLNTYFMYEREGERWTNLRDLHELYCAGHLFQGAIAVHRCTGRRDLLDVALRYADCICRVFGPEGTDGTCGHQEIEMALVELYRATGEARYLVQARLFMERRGRKPGVIGGSPYHQDHQPFRELDAVAGHAVRMAYYCCGGADVLAETGEIAYADALERLWRSMTTRRQYVTGGIGSRYEGEAFGEDFELPNERAYAESCAAIGSVMWNWRMLLLTGEARFADALEIALYNGVIPGLSLDGSDYFYQNPLADAGRHRRQPWFECACCPPNIARMLASLPGYFYSTSPEGVWVHLYASGGAEAALPSGARLGILQETAYPWAGELRFTLALEAPETFSLFLRIPGWCRNAAVVMDGERLDLQIDKGVYVELRREWKPGDQVGLLLEMPPFRLECHPAVAGNAGRVALQRGPLVYCVEQADLDGADPANLVLPTGSELLADWQPDLLGGVVVLRGAARLRRPEPAWDEALYRRCGETAPPVEGPRELVAVPYYAWANREPGAMAVWIHSDSSEA